MLSLEELNAIPEDAPSPSVTISPTAHTVSNSINLPAYPLTELHSTVDNDLVPADIADVEVPRGNC